jgi:two-component system, chemotaxis family, response regulator PixG
LPELNKENVPMQLSPSELQNKTHFSSDVVHTIRMHLQEQLSGCLEISSKTVKWFVYIDGGQLVYITHSIDPTDRLDLYLKGLSRRMSNISSDVRTQVRLSIDPGEEVYLRPDLQGIGLLGQDNILTNQAKTSLAMELSREALESLLLIQECTYAFSPARQPLKWLTSIEFDPLLTLCQQRLQAWQSLQPYIWSPYQRPYLFSQSQSAETLSPETYQRLAKLLKGFSFRHLANLLDQDELKLVKNLYPLIVDKLILLRSPQPPYSDLPNFAKVSAPEVTAAIEEVALLSEETINGTTHGANHRTNQPVPQADSRVYRVACIDDSPAMLQTIERFLGSENLSLFLIQESVKALIEMMRIKPDLILLDVGMPKVDGYELCRLLRKHPMFKTTPIIMVTGNTGLIDRAKAKLAGTTDYMTKPFTQSELSKMVFRHLT